ncbi:hypothetical protein OA07_03110 [Aphanizomenon flos-aquae 2012/KM1/D3]|nr:hypothetical protein OA07_03110 [Aphanizomenon flos-aquae 2012/KM1/D3]
MIKNAKALQNPANTDVIVAGNTKPKILIAKRMFEKWYSVIFITLLPPFPLVKGGNNKNPVPSPLQGEG